MATQVQPSQQKPVYTISPQRELSDSERYTMLLTQHQRAKAHEEKNLRRWTENIRCYWGIDNDLGLGQWPGNAVIEMLQQGRMIGTFNLARPSVDNIAGEILQSPFGFKFSPVDGSETTLTTNINNQIYADKELMDWRSVENEMVINGCIHRADIEMYISYEYNKNGNIGLRLCSPGSIFYSPDWKDGRSKTCKWADRVLYLSPKEILKTWGKEDTMRRKIVQSTMFLAFGKEYLKKLSEWEAIYGEEYGDNTGAVPYENQPDVWGSKLKVIEHYEMVSVTSKYEYVLTETGDEIVIPQLPDVAAKVEWLNENYPGWIPDQIFEDETQEDIQYVTVICPGLSQQYCIAHGPTEEQQGRLKFFPWSAFRLNGECGGILDAIIDAQRLLNYWESMLVHKMQTEGGGGSQFLDASYLESSQEADDYISNRNNPRRVFKLRKNALKELNGSSPAIPTLKSQFPSETYEHIRHLIGDMWPRLSRVTPASRGETDQAGESGVLYQQKRLQTMVERYVIHEGLRNWYNEIGEAYLIQSANKYKGHPRDFYNPKTKTAIRWNERVTVTDDLGRTLNVVINDITDLKRRRHKVLIVESEDSPTKKDAVINTATNAAKAIPQTRTLTLLNLSQKIIESLDVFDDEEKFALKEDYSIERELVLQQMKTGIVQSKLLELQTIEGINQLEQARIAREQQMAAAQAQAMQPGQTQTTMDGSGAMAPGPMSLGNSSVPQEQNQNIEQSIPQGAINA